MKTEFDKIIEKNLNCIGFWQFEAVVFDSISNYLIRKGITNIIINLEQTYHDETGSKRYDLNFKLINDFPTIEYIRKRKKRIRNKINYNWKEKDYIRLDNDDKPEELQERLEEITQSLYNKFIPEIQSHKGRTNTNYKELISTIRIEFPK